MQYNEWHLTGCCRFTDVRNEVVLDLGKCVKVINDEDVSIAGLASNVPEFSGVYVCDTHHKHTVACGKDNTEALRSMLSDLSDVLWDTSPVKTCQELIQVVFHHKMNNYMLHKENEAYFHDHWDLQCVIIIAYF